MQDYLNPGQLFRPFGPHQQGVETSAYPRRTRGTLRAEAAKARPYIPSAPAASSSYWRRSQLRLAIGARALASHFHKYYETNITRCSTPNLEPLNLWQVNAMVAFRTCRSRRTVKYSVKSPALEGQICILL